MAGDVKTQESPFGWMKLTPEQKEQVFQMFADLSEYFRLLRKESDRGCAMIVAAHLDDKLGELLRSCMIQDQEDKKELKQFFRGPLGSFASRIKLARYLNIISPQVRADLDTILDIRNDFGHKLEFEDFNTASIRARCMNLRHDLLEDSQNPRERFINTSNVLLFFIDFFLKRGAILGPYSNPRTIEIALMQDIMDAAGALHASP
jgi:hypothetical protein